MIKSRNLIGIAVFGALALTSFVTLTGTAGATATAKCANYTQLTRGGRADAFTDVQASKVSCKTALIVLEIFPNMAPGKRIEGFTCARHGAGKHFTARCAHGTKIVSFAYTT